MTKIFNSLDEIQKYYDKESNAYIFKENGKYINIVAFNFNLNVESNIDAQDIKAQSINAININASDISAWNIIAGDINAENINAQRINANNISYYAVCYAYENIKCKSIKGRKHNSKHFVLDGSIETTK